MVNYLLTYLLTYSTVLIIVELQNSVCGDTTLKTVHFVPLSSISGSYYRESGSNGLLWISFMVLRGVRPSLDIYHSTESEYGFIHYYFNGLSARILWFGYASSLTTYYLSNRWNIGIILMWIYGNCGQPLLLMQYAAKCIHILSCSILFYQSDICMVLLMRDEKN